MTSGRKENFGEKRVVSTDPHSSIHTKSSHSKAQLVGKTWGRQFYFELSLICQIHFCNQSTPLTTDNMDKMLNHMANQIKQLREENALQQQDHLGKRKREVAVDGSIKEMVQNLYAQYESLGLHKDELSDQLEAMKESPNANAIVQMLSCAASAQKSSIVELEKASQEKKKQMEENKRLKTITGSFADPTERPQMWESLFYDAARKGFTYSVQNFLEKGANVNVQDNLGKTALMLAARNGHTHTVRLLIQNDADVNLQSSLAAGPGYTALMGAAKEGHLEIVKLLIEAGAEINAQNHDGKTALVYAAKYGHDEIVKILIEKGVNIHHQDQDGISVLMYAVGKDHSMICQVLIDAGVNVNTEDSEDFTPLMYASQNGHTEITKKLLDKGTDVNAQDEYGRTALMTAAKNGHTNIVTLLLKKGAEINLQEESGSTALMLAAEKGHTEIVQLLESRVRKRKPLNMVADTPHSALAKKQKTEPKASSARTSKVVSTRNPALQNQFRETLTDESHCCVVTQCPYLDVIEAAHILPFHETESFDKDNGILLTATLHKAHDANLIHFDSYGKLWFRDDIPRENLVKSLGVPASFQQILPKLMTSGRKENLEKEFHRWKEEMDDGITQF